MHINDWVEQEFCEAPFGDDRLVKRLIETARTFYESPELSIPGSCQGYAQTRAAYRLLNNNQVKPEAILMGHREQTIERMKSYDTVLLIQDTMSVSYGNHSCIEGIGTHSTSKDDPGLLCHTCLAITEEGTPLGIPYQYIWTRDPEDFGKRDTKRKRDTKDKESQRWLDTLDYSIKGIPQYINTVTVCDREADVYDFFNKAKSQNQDLLARVTQNRRVLEENKYLIQEIKSQPIMGQILTSVPRDVENKRPPREATLSVKYCPVTIKPPLNRKDSKNLPNLKLYLVLAEEINPPADVIPINWLLITTLPIETLDQAVEKIKWYKQRWKIERFHYVLKSGCKIEELQLETMSGLKNVIAIYSVIAWKLLWIKLESENTPETSCDIVLQEHEWQALYCVANKTSNIPENPPTLKEAVALIAKLGGFLGRNCDKNPGVKVIWRGLRRLYDISQGWLAARLPINSQ